MPARLLSEDANSLLDRGIRILVLEDNRDWSDLVARVLKRHKEISEVVQAFDLAAAGQRLREGAFDLALVDLNVPDSRGLETLGAVREAGPRMAIVVMTGESDEDLAFRALRNGAQDYLLKGSIDTSNLIRTCRYAIERRVAELELLTSQQLLSRTLDGLPSCIAILDGAGTIQAVNRAWADFDDAGHPFIHGCQVGMNYLAICDRIPGEAEGVHPVAREVRLAIAGDTPMRRIDYAIGSGGEAHWYELSVNRSETPQGNSIVVAHLDINTRKDLEKRLRASEELFLIISQNVMDLMSIIDADGRRIYTSPSYLAALGYPEEEMLAHSFTDLLHPDDVERVTKSLRQLMATGQNRGLQYRLRHKDGAWRYFESNGVLITNVTSSQPQALVVARDITERKLAEIERAEMEVQLRHAQKLEAIGQLAAGIAHEINTPTQFIGDNTVFLRDSVQGLFGGIRSLEQAFRKCLQQRQDAHGLAELDRMVDGMDLEYLEAEIPKAIEQSLDGAARVTKIVSAMKEFSHPSTTQKVATDLNRAIESTVTVSRNEWKYLAEMELDFDPALPSVPCFPGEFNQVILNLVVNAAHAIEEFLGGRDSGRLGRIRISTRCRDGWAVVAVSDTGKGIPEAIRDRIFEPFFTTKPVGRGTGQGLAIAHSVIVEKHGGRITVESEPGLGTTFTLHLPLEEAAHG